VVLFGTSQTIGLHEVHILALTILLVGKIFAAAQPICRLLERNAKPAAQKVTVYGVRTDTKLPKTLSHFAFSAVKVLLSALENWQTAPKFVYAAIECSTDMSEKEQPKHVYRVLFHNQGQVYEVYARNIYQSDLYGFVEIEDYTFGNRSQMLIDPSEDRLRNEFEGVQRSFIPMHAIVRIDEVEKEGVAKITDNKGDKVTPFPIPIPRDTS
jgi:hypothetical protein